MVCNVKNEEAEKPSVFIYLDDVDTHKDLDGFVAGQPLEESIVGVSPGDGAVLNVRGQRDFVDPHRALQGKKKEKKKEDKSEISHVKNILLSLTNYEFKYV